MVMTNSQASPRARRPYKGVFPVVPTVFDGEGRLDLDGPKRAVDCMIDAGSQGLSLVLRWGK
jgi:2-keto-3-deoxy-L-arabinonate dehydratase